VRRRAGRALGMIGDASAVAPLGAALNYKGSDSKEEDEARAAAAEALANIGDAQAVEPLSAILANINIYSPKARQTAAWSLCKLADNGVNANRLKPAVNPLCLMLDKSDADLRLRAAHALARIGDARAVEPLCAALSYKGVSWDDRHRVDEVRAAVAKALASIGDARAVEALCAVLAS
jgi:HEAT repeat protein